MYVMILWHVCDDFSECYKQTYKSAIYKTVYFVLWALLYRICFLGGGPRDSMSISIDGHIGIVLMKYK